MEDESDRATANRSQWTRTQSSRIAPGEFDGGGFQAGAQFGRFPGWFAQLRSGRAGRPRYLRAGLQLANSASSRQAEGCSAHT